MPDPNVCTICEEELDDTQPFQRDLEGNGAHLDCLETVEEEDDAE
jgi:hypothetical protein